MQSNQFAVASLVQLALQGVSHLATPTCEAVVESKQLYPGTSLLAKVARVGVGDYGNLASLMESGS